MVREEQGSTDGGIGDRSLSGTKPLALEITSTNRRVATASSICRECTDSEDAATAMSKVRDTARNL
jgi:hypothetical protein